MNKTEIPPRNCSPAVALILSLIMSCTALTYGIHFKQLTEELNYLPNKAHKAFLMAHVSAVIVCRLIGGIGRVRFIRLRGLFIFVATAIITFIVAVFVFVAESGDCFVICTAAISTGINYQAAVAAVRLLCY